MEKAASINWIMAEQDERLTETIGREQGRLRNFIRRRVADESDAEDILQDVFYELIEAYRLTKPIEQVGAWLYRVARNRIIDGFRKKKPEPFSPERDPDAEDGDSLSLEELLPSPDEGPEAAYARTILLEELDAAIDELPEEQREEYFAHRWPPVPHRATEAILRATAYRRLQRPDLFRRKAAPAFSFESRR